VTTILLTGFGPFPGAPFNPTAGLVRELARKRGAFPGVRRVAHVFATSYRAVDQELPALIVRERPDALIMFGLAARAREIRIERRARNRVACHPDAAGLVPTAGTISPNAATAMSLCIAAPRILAAVRAAGTAAALSIDAGTYLCNYVSWRAVETARRERVPRLVAFVHVPLVHRARLADLINAGEAIIEAALPAARIRH
jgi:pyroglutamyl-peptidase